MPSSAEPAGDDLLVFNQKGLSTPLERHFLIPASDHHYPSVTAQDARIGRLLRGSIISCPSFFNFRPPGGDIHSSIAGMRLE